MSKFSPLAKQIIIKNANKADESLRIQLAREAGNRLCCLHLFTFKACEKTGFDKDLWLNCRDKGRIIFRCDFTKNYNLDQALEGMSTDEISHLSDWSLSLFTDYLPHISWKVNLEESQIGDVLKEMMVGEEPFVSFAYKNDRRLFDALSEKYPQVFSLDLVKFSKDNAASSLKPSHSEPLAGKLAIKSL